MNDRYLGDSYDIVKRFFVGELRSLGYCVYVDPMASGDWAPVEASYLKLLAAVHVRETHRPDRSALLLDPDTGIRGKPGRSHVSMSNIVERLAQHEIVLVFDQSFSYNEPKTSKLGSKLRELESHGASGFYYDSHAPFLFASFSKERLGSVRKAILGTGLPERRLVSLQDSP